MSGNVIQSPFYNSGFYNTGAGGGGGLPEEYIRCAYIEYVVQNGANVAYNLNIPVERTDTLKFMLSISGGDSGYNDGVTCEFRTTSNQLVKFKIIFNTNTIVTRVQSFWMNADKSGNLGMFICGRNGSSDDLFIDGVLTPGDDRNNDIIKLTTLLDVPFGNYKGTRISSFEISAQDGTTKNLFIPVIKNGATQMVLDAVTLTEYPLDTSKIICGPLL